MRVAVLDGGQYVLDATWRAYRAALASSTGTGARNATTTDYVFNGDTLVSTIDQKLPSGVATGTAQTHYIHPDHLGSTNVVTNASGTVEQTLDFFPYGSTRISTGQNTESRQFIGQFTDQSALSYLDARYYDASRGQFLSEDPIFQGDPQQQNLTDPQSLNAYSYAEDNPIRKKDPSGKCPECVTALLGAGAGLGGQYIIDVANNIGAHGLAASDFYSNLSSPQTYLTRAAQGAIIGATGGLAGGTLGLGTFGQSVVVGGTSGITGALGNAYLNEPVTPQSFAFNTLIGGATFGFSELAPGVPGALPKFGTTAFYTGAHTQEQALQLAVDALSEYLRYALAAIAAPVHAIIPATSQPNTYSTPSASISTGVSASAPSTGGGGGYGSSGSSYTNYIPANTHTACGTLCL